MLSLLLLTGLSLLCVVMNVAQIVAGFRSLPIYQTAVEEFGITSLSSFGAIGVIIEGKPSTSYTWGFQIRHLNFQRAIEEDTNKYSY